MPLINDPDFGDGKSAKAPAGTPTVGAWTMVVAANLPVPLAFGMLVTDAGGRAGMACGVLLIYWLGLHARNTAPRAMIAVIRGGWAVAALQILPILQMAAGAAGLILASVIGSARFHVFPNVDAVVDGFLATVATGAILIVVAAASGSLREFETSTRPSPST